MPSTSALKTAHGMADVRTISPGRARRASVAIQKLFRGYAVRKKFARPTELVPVESPGASFSPTPPFPPHPPFHIPTAVAKALQSFVSESGGVKICFSKAKGGYLQFRSRKRTLGKRKRRRRKSSPPFAATKFAKASRRPRSPKQVPPLSTPTLTPSPFPFAQPNTRRQSHDVAPRLTLQAA